MTFLFDENFPPRLPEALRALGYDAQHVLEHLPLGTEDTAIFAFLAEKGWVWVSHDKGVKRKPHERLAFREAGLGAIVFSGRAQRSANGMAVFVLQHIEEMRRLAEHTQRPFVLALSDRGKFEELE